MTEHQQLSDEHLDLWHEGCLELVAMTAQEWDEGRSERYRCFQAISKALTWALIGPHSVSLFDPRLDGPPVRPPEYGQTIDWEISRAWRRALIEATGETPRWPRSRN
jgi:hypothetical protein